MVRPPSFVWGVFMNDEQIAALIAEEKIVANPSARWSHVKNVRQKTFSATSQSGNTYSIVLRQNTKYAENFSCGIRLDVPGADPLMLVRYNGSDHGHSNPIENTSWPEGFFHIHRATQRYIESGRKSEHFAETTQRFTTLASAFRCMVKDCNIQGLESKPATDDLFGEP